MDYYRHCFNDSDFIQNSLNALADFGFVEKSTREPYYGSFPLEENTPDWKKLCWKNDLKADLYIEASDAQVSQSWRVCLSISPSKSSISRWSPISHQDNMGERNQIHTRPILGQGETRIDVVGSGWYNSIIMMPLINGGFLYNVNFLNRYPGSPTNYTIRTIDPTPKIKIVGEYDDTLCNLETNRTLIGVPNTLNTNLNNYLYFGLTGAYDGATKGDITQFKKFFLTDYQNASTLTSIPFINTDSTDYTDLNNNICTLIKMPYDNGYLDNVYMMATRPGELTKEGSFFSFAGRNFINVYKNLVLELPS